MRALIDLLLTSHPHQRLRLAQASLAALLMVACVIAMHGMTAAGLNDGRGLWTWTACSLVGLLVVFALIRFGWSRRLADPSMTMPQMAYAIACSAWGYAIAGGGHGAVPLILALILMFGMFGLSSRQVMAVGVYALLLYGAVMAVMVRVDPQTYPAHVELAYFAMILIVLCGVVALSARLTIMRERLRLQRRELETALHRIGELATHDDLTGLINRRRMHELLQQQRERSERDQRPWCLALIDVDHFKQVNDRHGHAVGDMVLQAVAHACVAQIRKVDVLSRWGGEEFVLLLLDVSTQTAASVVDRMRQRIGAQALPAGDAQLTVTFSAGVTGHRPGESVAQMLERADKSLYEAKSLGRDRVVVAAE